MACCRGRIKTSTSTRGGQYHVHSKHVHLGPHTAHKSTAHKSAASSVSNQSQGSLAMTQHVPQLRSSRNTTNARCFGMILWYGWPPLHCYRYTQFMNDKQELGEPSVIGDLELTVATRCMEILSVGTSSSPVLGSICHGVLFGGSYTYTHTRGGRARQQNACNHVLY